MVIVVTLYKAFVPQNTSHINSLKMEAPYGRVEGSVYFLQMEVYIYLILSSRHDYHILDNYSQFICLYYNFNFYNFWIFKRKS